MKITITAFLFAERNVKVDHQKSPEKSELKVIQIYINLSISETSGIDEIIDIKS